MSKQQLMQDYSNAAAAVGQIELQIQQLKQNKITVLITMREILEKMQKAESSDGN